MIADDGTTEALTIIDTLNAVKEVVRPGPVVLTREEGNRWLVEMGYQGVRGVRFVGWDEARQLFYLVK